MVITIGNLIPSECTQVANIPLQAYKKDAEGKLEVLTPHSLQELTHDSSGEATDPAAGMQKILNDNDLNICNTIESGHARPWGRKHTPFVMYLGGCRPVEVTIDWVDFDLLFGDIDIFPGDPPDVAPFKLPDRAFPGITGWQDLLYPFSFRHWRGHDNPPTNSPSLISFIEVKWFDENSVDGDPGGIDEGVFDSPALPVLSDENDYIEIQARIPRDTHFSDIGGQTVEGRPEGPEDPWITQAKLTCEHVNEVMDGADTGEEFEQWLVPGTNAGIILDPEGADPALAPDGYIFRLNMVYKYSLPSA